MKTNIPEEESLTTIIKDIEKMIRNFMNWILNIVNKVGYIIATILKSWKKIVLVGIVGGAIGASSLLIFPREYASDLVIRTYIDANEQLFTDVEYLNTLMEANRHDKVASLLGLSVDKIKK